MEAESEDAVNQRLRAQQLSPTKGSRRRPARLQVPDLGTGVGPVKATDLVTFTRLFATMIDAGLPIVQCLDILQGQTENKHFANVLRDVMASVEQGATFSDSLRRHPKVFDHLFVNLVQAGEVGGILDTILNRLAVYIEKAMKLRRQVQGAMVYPSIVVIVFLGVLTILLVFVIPGFETMFKDFGAKDALPALTVLVMSGLAMVREPHHRVPRSSALVGAGQNSASRRSTRRPAQEEVLPPDAAAQGLPVIGMVIRKIAVARFTRTLGTLLSSGVPILDAMEIVAKTAGNVIVEEAILYSRARIAEGKNMAEPLMQTNVFPPMVVQMVGVGEQTGALDTMLNKIADFYEQEVDVAVSAMTSLIEPVMMVGIGGTVGVVLISMYLPIFSIAGNIKGD